ncbi:MAG: DUF2284 domain-containing protein [Clostridia bacterium]|nr:DUF2284 domain-containing protein [Clostridia bacterium]
MIPFDPTDTVLRSGFTEAGYLDKNALRFYPEVRDMCAQNTCRAYGKTWACPPGVGTLEECRDRMLAYDRILLFSMKCELEDSYDYEGMMAGRLAFKEATDRLDEAIKGKLDHYLLLGNESCERCETCTYPDAPCRFPHLLRHSLESYCLVVSELAEHAGILYYNGEATVTYFGALLF